MHPCSVLIHHSTCSLELTLWDTGLHFTAISTCESKGAYVLLDSNTMKICTWIEQVGATMCCVGFQGIATWLLKCSEGTKAIFFPLKVAQLVKYSTSNTQVMGSIPHTDTMFTLNELWIKLHKATLKAYQVWLFSIQYQYVNCRWNGETTNSRIWSVYQSFCDPFHMIYALWNRQHPQEKNTLIPY